MKKEYADLRRRTLLTPIWLSALAVLAALGVAAWFWSSLSTTTVIVVRHAEKELGTIDDAPLSQIGEQRAQLLARMFGDREGPGRIAAIFASNTRRAQLTAAPLAERLRIGVDTMTDAGDVQGLARTIRTRHRGQRVLVIGHSNTVPEIVRAVSRNIHVPPMADDEYSTIYIVTVPTLGRASVLKLTY
jgi:broad specificity phosphatase PhoE